MFATESVYYVEKPLAGRLLDRAKKAGAAVMGLFSRANRDDSWKAHEQALQEAAELKGKYTWVAGGALTRLTQGQYPGNRRIEGVANNLMGSVGIRVEDCRISNLDPYPVDISVPRTTLYDYVITDRGTQVREQHFAPAITGDLQVTTRLGIMTRQGEFISQSPLMHMQGATQGHLDQLTAYFEQLEAQRFSQQVAPFVV